MLKQVKAPKGFPSEVKIAGQKWKIYYISGMVSEENLFGATNTAMRAITIDADQSGESMCDTILHEIFHALLHQWGFQPTDGEQEEKLCRILAPALVDFLRNNKRFW